MTIVQTTYDVTKTDITFSKKRYEVPFYGCIQQRNKSMNDSRDILMTLTQSESWFFWTMDKAKDIETNEVMFSRACCPESKLNYFTKVIKSLVDKNMILRIKQNHYLINPNVTMPKFESYSKVLDKWNSLGGLPL